MRKAPTKHSIYELHGCSYEPTWLRWQYMIRRCKIQSATGYQNYGGRGIKISIRWFRYLNFLKDMGPLPSPKHSIERIDNDRGYFPNNCRWAIKADQARNTRRTKLHFYKNKQMTLPEIAQLEGVNFQSLRWKVLRSKYKTNISEAVQWLKS